VVVMPMEIQSKDGRYLLAVQDDGNVVVYDRGRPVWDRWTHEAAEKPAPGPDPPVPVERPRPSSRPDVRVIRVTDETDGQLVNRMYAYWSSAWVSGGTVYVFVGHADGRPRFFQVDIASGQVSRRGPLLPYRGEGEGWYFDLDGWVYLTDGPRLRRVNPFTGEDRVVFDIADTHPGCRIWQAHSSEDGAVHSATVQRILSDGPYTPIGTVVYRNSQQEFFPAQGALDESQITSDGQFLIIHEDHHNRIINLETRDMRLLIDDDGAVEHSDCGRGYIVGEDNIHGECVLWDLRQPLTPARRKGLFSTWNMGHVSVKGGRCLVSDQTHLSLVALDGGGVTPLIEHGMTGSGYDYQVHGNLDPTGRVACYVSNMHGRFDVYLLTLEG
jgi:hypothetical protein